MASQKQLAVHHRMHATTRAVRPPYRRRRATGLGGGSFHSRALDTRNHTSYRAQRGSHRCRCSVGPPDKAGAAAVSTIRLLQPKKKKKGHDFLSRDRNGTNGPDPRHAQCNCAGTCSALLPPVYSLFNRTHVPASSQDVAAAQEPNACPHCRQTPGFASARVLVRANLGNACVVTRKPFHSLLEREDGVDGISHAPLIAGKTWLGLAPNSRP